MLRKNMYSVYFSTGNVCSSISDLYVSAQFTVFVVGNEISAKKVVKPTEWERLTLLCPPLYLESFTLSGHSLCTRPILGSAL